LRTPRSHPQDRSRPGRCVIIAGSPEFVAREVRPDDYVIACDAGYGHAVAAGIVPDLAMGDFDSFCGTVRPPTRVIRFGSVKDDSDTMLAVRHALSEGYRRFLLLGALGGRLDHQHSNICAGAHIAMHGGECAMAGKDCDIYFVHNGKLTLEKKEGCFLSVFSFAELSRGVSLQGVKYPLSGAQLSADCPVGLSNEFETETANIEVLDGLLIVFVAKACPAPTIS